MSVLKDRNKVDAIVLDLDGTLLNSNKMISKRNLDSILEIHKLGIPIIIATARPPRAIKEFLPKELQEIAVFVYYNGALIVNQQLQIDEHYSIKSTINEQIIEYLISNEPDHLFSIEVNDTWYSYKEIDYRSFMKVSKNPEIIEIVEIKLKSPTKILVSHLKNIEDFNKKFGDKVNVINTDSNQLTQIMKLGISKESAITNLAERLDISLEKTMVFGDDFNDLGLFKICGIPIAMDNSIDELKSIAKKITTSNDEDGVANILETLCN
ncbi:HAD family hydrolase [Lysinibacillus mangiferihumi]|uniref:HAD family hydrolase n=1 Tax=Lysinibacillus mangiferihumi TaxID=1130819 RepID=A0A4U2Y050_9BACI|nr:HAD family hydrolase [Lysinibacillus mangiferihumi]TKI53185.1 HAD family hydrolase [Lysinibacillus mangiferihumi]